MSARKILITGATGKQGTSAIKALLANPPPYDYHILALTRKSTSKAAKSLAANAKITVIEGDLNDCDSIFTKAGGVGSIWGVFCVTIVSMKKDGEKLEMKQGMDLVDAAIAHAVKHFVFTSVDRGGPDQSEVDATDVPHFVSKYNVEKHLKSKVRGTDMTYTILRPVAFMDNLTPDFPGRVFASMWANLGDKPLQFVATPDIGIFAAKAFASPATDDYKNTAISLAGDELTQAQANEVFWKVLGRPMPRSYGIFATLLQTMIPEMGLMFRWMATQGFGSDLNKCRSLNSNMLDFETWLRDQSGFKR